MLNFLKKHSSPVLSHVLWLISGLGLLIGNLIFLIDTQYAEAAGFLPALLIMVLYGFLGHALRKKNKILSLGILTALIGLLMYVSVLGISDGLFSCFRCADELVKAELTANWIWLFSNVAFLVGCFTLLLGKYVLTNKKALATSISVIAFLADFLVCLVAYIIYFVGAGNTLTAAEAGYEIFTSIYELLIPLAILISTSCTESLTKAQ